MDTPCCTPRVRTTSWLSAGINTVLGRGPHPHDDAHRGATGWTAGHARWRGLARRRLAIAGVSRRDQEADGRERDGTAGMEQADVADLHEAVRQDVWEEPAEKLHDIKVRSAEAGTASLPVREGDRAVCEADETVIGDGTLADIRGEGGEGGGAVGLRLTVDVPRDGPDLGVDVRQQAGVAHGFFEESAVERGEGFDGDKDVGSGRQPSGAIVREAAARDDSVDVGVVLELPTPGGEDTGAPREVGADETLVAGKAFAGRGRRLQQGLGRKALMRTDARSAGLGHGGGEEDVRPGQVCGQVVLEPLVGCMVLTLGAVAVATGMMHAMVFPTVLARREAVTVRAALALVEGADALAVYGGERGRAGQGLRGTGGEERAQGGPGRGPRMRAVGRGLLQ